MKRLLAAIAVLGLSFCGCGRERDVDHDPLHVEGYAIRAPVGTLIDHPINVRGAVPPIVTRIVAGELPPGVSLVPGTRMIRGLTTTAGTYRFTIEVESASRRARGDFVWIIETAEVGDR